MNFADIGLVNTFVPLAGLVALALGLPLLTVPRRTRSHTRLAAGIALAAAGTLIASALLFAGLHALAGNGVRPEAVRAPTFMAALVWVPILALVWFARAQGVEERRGEDMARGARSPTS